MSLMEQMVKSHPARANEATAAAMPPELLAEAIETLQRCAQICDSCADACLGEPDVADLVDCIRTDLDCADVCRAAASILARQTETNGALVRAQLEACVTACRICEEDCRKHADHHDHCRICAESCAECATTCQQVLNSMTN